jgi:hypothetical protein
MPKTITASVGIHGKNFNTDTETVQNLLNNVPVNAGGPNPRIDPDGKCGPKTCNAIQMFQLKNFGWSGADGRVDPDGVTLLALNIYSPDPVPQPKPVPTPTPEPLSTDFIFWLRHKPKFFSHPYDPNEFVWTVIDVTNGRQAAYGLKFNGKVGTAPPSTGSGGHTFHLTLKTPSTISGLGGQAVYQTVMKRGSGPVEERLKSMLVVVVGSGNGYSAKYGCHILKPNSDGSGASGASDDAASGQFIGGDFHYNLNGFFVKL